MHASHSGNELFSGHFFDVLAMNMYASSLTIFSVAILFDIKKRLFYIFLLADFIVIVILMKLNLSLPNLGGGGLFELFIGFAFINEVLVSLGISSKVFKNKGARQIRRSFILLIFIPITFLIAFWFWHYGLTNAPTCDPYSWWQWHAVWHFITACATLLIGCYILTEKQK
ncbi:MAG: hypothetical protein ACOC44_11470 [Promethearchaeia archaeon]